MLVGVLIKRNSFFLFVHETCVQYLIVLFTANIIYFILKSDCLVGNVSHFLWNINYRVQITNNRSTFPMGFMGVWDVHLLVSIDNSSDRLSGLEAFSQSVTRFIRSWKFALKLSHMLSLFNYLVPYIWNMKTRIRLKSIKYYKYDNQRLFK